MQIVGACGILIYIQTHMYVCMRGSMHVRVSVCILAWRVGRQSACVTTFKTPVCLCLCVCARLILQYLTHK